MRVTTVITTRAAGVMGSPVTIASTMKGLTLFRTVDRKNVIHVETMAKQANYPLGQSLMCRRGRVSHAVRTRRTKSLTGTTFR